MKPYMKKIFCYVLVVSIFSFLLVACSTEKSVTNQEENTHQYVFNGYPMETDVTLAVWVPLNAVISTQVKNMAETPFAQELEKQTGVKLEYIHPVLGQDAEQFNLLLASGELPDIIEYPWYNFAGGPEKAIKDNYILRLNELIDENAPNLKAYLEANEDVDKMVKTDEGSYYVFPFIRGHESLTVAMGPIIRKDWLDDLEMEMPTTIDEWYTVLKVFKEKKNAASPLSIGKGAINQGFLIGAYGIKQGFYVDDGKVKFGAIEPEYKEFLITLRKWFSEGLVDNNFAMMDDKIISANMLSGKSGASVGYLASNMGRWLNAMKDKDPKYDLAGTMYPTLNKGEIPKFGHKDFRYGVSGGTAITTSCKNPEIAARFLDYAYGEKGNLLYNFGIEGISYNMVDGYPEYSDLITNNPEGLSMSEAMSTYVRAYNQGPFIQDKRYGEQYFAMPQQQQALEAWTKTDAIQHIMPRVTPTSEESSEVANIMNEVNTYVDEMFLKFIMGVEPIENFDEFVQQLKKLNIDRAIEIRQAALERYYNR